MKMGSEWVSLWVDTPEITAGKASRRQVYLDHRVDPAGVWAAPQ
jgi:hypothetical protein